MSHLNGRREFLSLPLQHYPSDDEFSGPIQPALDTLFSAFSQRHRSISPVNFTPTRSMPEQLQTTVPNPPQALVDLRSLDYLTEYDSHLMCPICHVPFIEPIVLDCDHTFCTSCFDEYIHGATSSERSRCPSCRTYTLSSPKKASRLISNMCNDIKVRCPNQECTTIMARGCIERHVEKDCLEQLLACPDTECEKQSKRKNYVPGQCIHSSHIECDCGAVIELGRGEWLKHKDEDCPTTTVQCEQCGERVTVKDYLAGTKAHNCQANARNLKCPGAEFGCADEVLPDDLEVHLKSCMLARLAPHLSQQSRLLKSMTEQVAESKLRNEMLESGLERINELLTNQMQPKLEHLYNYHQDHYQDVEEIEREHVPNAAAVHHRDLLLPAHLRDLTPSPTFSQANIYQQPPVSSHQHLLALHESLRSNVTNLEADMANLHHNVTELDARTSMQLMNETLRLKEELAHVNAALFSTRAQVQWLLNRERMNMGMMRGRPPLAPSQQSQGQDQSQDQPGPSSQAQTQPATDPSSTSHGGSSSSAATPLQASDLIDYFTNNSNQSSTATSPRFRPLGSESLRRPSMRRPSGGSQDRVKL